MESDGRSRSGDERALAHQSRHWGPRARAAQHVPVERDNNASAAVGTMDSSFSSPDGQMQTVTLARNTGGVSNSVQKNNSKRREILNTPTPERIFPASPPIALSPVSQPETQIATHPLSQPATPSTTQLATQPLFGFQASTVSVLAHQGGVEENLLQHAADRVLTAENTAAEATRAAEQVVQDARNTAVWAVAQSQIDANARVNAAEQNASAAVAAATHQVNTIAAQSQVHAQQVEQQAHAELQSINNEATAMVSLQQEKHSAEVSELQHRLLHQQRGYEEQLQMQAKQLAAVREEMDSLKRRQSLEPMSVSTSWMQVPTAEGQPRGADAAASPNLVRQFVNPFAVGSGLQSSDVPACESPSAAPEHGPEANNDTVQFFDINTSTNTETRESSSVFGVDEPQGSRRPVTRMAMRGGDERSQPQRGTSESRKGASGPALRRSTTCTASGVGRHSNDAKQRQRSPETRARPSRSASRRGQDDFVRQKTNSGKDDMVGKRNAQEDSVRCQCGHVNRAKAKFCESCGSMLRSDEAVFSPPARSYNDARDYHDITGQEESHEEAQSGPANWFYDDEGSQEDSCDSSDSSDSDDDESNSDDDGGHRGRRGGPSSGSSPRKQGFLGDFGGDPSRDNGFDFSHCVKDETEIYKDKDLQQITVPDIPLDSVGKRSWMNKFQLQLSKIDRSKNDVLIQWFSMCDSELGDPDDVLRQFGKDSQGLDRLDKYLGALIGDKGVGHPTFGIKFSTYIEGCNQRHCSPRCRVLVAMICQRFRLDRARGRSLNIHHLLGIQLQSYKMSDVVHFVERVRYCQINLRPGEVKDEELLFQWLFDKFKGWSQVSDEVKKIKRSRPDSRRRTWGYLWGAIRRVLDYSHEDNNCTVLANALAGNKVHGVVADPKKKQPKQKSNDDKDNSGSKKANEKPKKDSKKESAKSQAPAAVAPKASGKDQGGKGNNVKKNKEKGKPSKGLPPLPPATFEAAKTPPADRTPAQKKLLACRFFIEGKCSDANCEYSHDPEICKDFKKRLEAKKKAKGAGKAKATVAAPVMTAAVAAGLVAGSEGASAPSPRQAPAGKRWFGSKLWTAVKGAAATVLTITSPDKAASMVGQITDPGALLLQTFDPCDALIRGVDHNVTCRPETAFAAISREHRHFGKTRGKAQTDAGKVFDIEIINDSGAGRMILSKSALVQQGVPGYLIDKHVKDASQQMVFECGGGDVDTNKSLQIASPLTGKMEAYVLPGSPVAACMGYIVDTLRRPFIWIPGQLPFHVTDLRQLKLKCPLKYRHYADRVEQNVPIFKTKMRIGDAHTAAASPNFLQTPAMPAASSGEGVSAPPGEPEAEGVDEMLTVPDVPCDDPPEDVVADITIQRRDMSRRALILEAASLKHKRSHYPHNPFCEICRRAHMRQKSVGRTKGRDDDGLPAVDKPCQRLSADHVILQRSAVEQNGVEDYVCFSIRDEFSGCGLMCPELQGARI